MRTTVIVPKGRFELPHPCGYSDLNAACLPFHHFGIFSCSIDTLFNGSIVQKSYDYIDASIYCFVVILLTYNKPQTCVTVHE